MGTPGRFRSTLLPLSKKKMGYLLFTSNGFLTSQSLSHPTMQLSLRVDDRIDDA